MAKNILTAYFSASGNTEKMAKKIADFISCDIFKISPQEDYKS